MIELFYLNNIEAVIFDMDGTMINNMPYHKKTWLEFCKRYGLSLTEEEFKNKYSGKKNDQIFKGLFNKNLSQEEINKYTEEKEQMYRDLYSPLIKEVDGLSDLIGMLKTSRIKLAIATTAPEKNRDLALKKLDLLGAFDVIVGDEEVKHGKPDPEIYLITAKKLQVAAEKCMVFEDSPPGVEAAKRAGMKVIGILTTHSKEELNKADLVINNFSELKLAN
ncbi:MAG: hypothetical protein A2172_01925 [Candidatus Woykebacteria bacterium RBG_13_40_15]|uniref:Uncharacterized protein n=1 Tax=Candidatus Woykebacteria bacterium RBG_13_40_15 TaxID=1802593 RepID=A0A1G1W5G4_9BACT|nr:MAG: hypothetical protein A2172_01925 [Candidatus Woykebacteria bacterium RBG_13_40_15]